MVAATSAASEIAIPKEPELCGSFSKIALPELVKLDGLATTPQTTLWGTASAGCARSRPHQTAKGAAHGRTFVQP